MLHKSFACFFFILMFFLTNQSFAVPPASELGLRLEGYDYPYPVHYVDLTIEGKSLQMAYMDILPDKKTSTPQTILLLHGGLAMGSYWKDTIKFLSAHNYRVIVPDQIGFGKSSKENVHYHLHLLASNTKSLLNFLGIHNVIILGHSFGGMLGIRFTLMYPEVVTKLILEDPLGLEDYRLKIPYKSTDELFKLSLHPTWKSILATHKALYTHWKNNYQEYAEVPYRVSLNAQYSKIALVQALIYEMIYLEPVVYEFEKIKIPTLLIFGDQDRTAPGKLFASEEAQKTLGDFKALSKKTSAIIHHIEVKRFEKKGHVPHLEATEQFNITVDNFVRNYPVRFSRNVEKKVDSKCLHCSLSKPEAISMR